MSRYNANLPDNKKLSWGYDAPLQEYFIEQFDEYGEHEYALGTSLTLVPHPSAPQKMRYSKGDIIPYFEMNAAYIPSEHINALMLDIPF